MGIPPRGIKLGDLPSATPSSLSTDALKNQLENVGLSCKELSDSFLAEKIEYVSSQLSQGSTQSCAIKAPAGSLAPIGSVAPAVAEFADMTSVEAQTPSLETAATGNWTTNATADGYLTYLEIIQYEPHFQWLYDNRGTNGFTGTIDNPPTITHNEPNAEAIMNLFVTVGTTASATLVKGLDQETMKATLHNAIQPLANADLSNYNSGNQSRVIGLVDNYNPSTGYVDGLGVLTMSWTLGITDYKRKTKDGGDTHPTVLNIKARSVLYSSLSDMCKDYNAVVANFKLSNATACSW